MRAPKFTLLVTLTALISPIPCLAQSQSKETATGSAAGVVVLAVDDRPIRHARVELLISSTGWAASTLTDRHGKFEFAGLPPTSYQVTVTAPACERLEATLTVDGRVGPLFMRLRKAEQPATPRNDSVVSVQELRTSGKAESAFEKAPGCFRTEMRRQASLIFSRALAKNPGYYRAYHNLGLAHYRLGQIAQAEEDFQKSTDLTNGGYAPSQFALGMIEFEQQEFRQAERLIQNGLAVEPGSALGKYFLGLTQFAMNRLPEAEKSAQEALFRSADQAYAYILLAKIHEREHNPYGVMADLAAYLKLDPHGPLEDEASSLLKRAQQDISRYSAASH